MDGVYPFDLWPLYYKVDNDLYVRGCFFIEFLLYGHDNDLICGQHFNKVDHDNDL